LREIYTFLTPLWKEVEMVQDIQLPEAPDWMDKAKERARDIMDRHESCAQSILVAFMETFGIEDPMVVRTAGAFHGGMMTSLTCGVHVGALMFLGLLMGREDIEEGLEGLMPVIGPTHELVARLTDRLGSHSCRELTGVDFTDLDQAMNFYVAGENKKCIDRVAEGAQVLAAFLVEKKENGELFRT
jgi:C_GCAxxG_C_C family probable redox protein